MKEAKLTNPFPIVGYYGATYFCDREKETSQLISSIKNGSSTTLMSIRRIGKTGLIYHTFSQLSSDYKSIYIDILATENLSEFLNTLTTSILQAVSPKSSIGNRFWKFIQSLRPIITFDTFSGAPQVTFNIVSKDVERSIKSVLEFLDGQGFKTVIAIDEFQQIMKYPEHNADAWLRSIIQQLKNITFIFSGSQQHIMAELLTSPDRPFYRSAQFLRLGKIDKEIYADFVARHFENRKKSIDIELVKEIMGWCNTHTYYVQLVFNRIFSATKTSVTADIWHQQAKQIIEEQEVIFINYRNMLTKSQWKLLKAIAAESVVFSPTSKKFLSKYNLGSSAALIRTLKSLQKYELVYSDTTPDGSTFYSMYDVLLQQWSKEKYPYDFG